jgi:hypothetical protein
MGIQNGHAAMKYARKYKNDEEYIEWIDNCVTSIILNGGTTNTSNDKNYGSMNKILDVLLDKNIKCCAFYEPGLGNQLTSVVFIADERVFDHVKWPVFSNFMKEKLPLVEWLKWFKNGQEVYEKAKEEFNFCYKEWVELIGGENNVFFKEYLPTFSLA